MGGVSISERTIAFLIAHEVTSVEHYNRVLCRPSLPGAQSGVTIGIGYDLGQVTAVRFREDWLPYLRHDLLDRLASCCGFQSAQARNPLMRVRDVVVPWEAADAVFRSRSIPHHLSLLLAAVPGLVALPEPCVGALLSLVYNRGPGGFTAVTDRYREMRAIRAAIADGAPEAVPGQLRRMRRVWAQNPDDPEAEWVPVANVAGLFDRRMAEAEMFERGLALRAPPAVADPAPADDRGDVAAPAPAAATAVDDVERTGGLA